MSIFLPVLGKIWYFDQQLRHKMTQKGRNMTKMSIFMPTRCERVSETYIYVRMRREEQGLAGWSLVLFGAGDFPVTAACEGVALVRSPKAKPKTEVPSNAYIFGTEVPCSDGFAASRIAGCL